MKLRILGRAVAVVIVVYALTSAGLFYAMRRPPETFGAIMAKVPSVAMFVLPFEPLWMSARSGKLQVGDSAPDFSLPALDGSRTVRLSEELRNRPVVLIFGSYT